MIKVLFICHGNICRSPMAEYVFKHITKQQNRSQEFHIASCATSTEEIGNDIHRGTKAKLKQMGIPFSTRQARQLTKRDYQEYDYLIAMDSYNIRNIHRIIGSDPEGKVSLLLDFAGEHRDIADPWYTGNFDDTYNDVWKGCQALLQYIDEHPSHYNQ